MFQLVMFYFTAVAQAGTPFALIINQKTFTKPLTQKEKTK
jgi:hypothetical protein